VPAAQAKRIPAGIAPTTAVLAANMETAIKIVHDLRPALGDVVVVVGLGVVGLLVTWLLARQQLTSVIGVDPVALRRELAQQLGADAVCSPSDAAAVVAVATHGRGADGVVEVSGNPAALAGAVAVAGFEAQVVVASWYGTKAVTLDLGSHFHRSRIRLRASQVGHLAPDLLPRWDYARRMEVVWRQLAQFPAQLLVSHYYHFSDAPQAYAVVDGGGADIVQVVLHYGERNSDV
jgi:threonine dehydrogenase-like Zn-dependent dehydrogenase